MVHQTTVPPPADGGNGRMAGGTASVVVTWNPPHDIPPAVERRRIERADRMRLEIEAMLNQPYGDGE